MYKKPIYNNNKKVAMIEKELKESPYQQFVDVACVCKSELYIIYSAPYPPSVYPFFLHNYVTVA